MQCPNALTLFTNCIWDATLHRSGPPLYHPRGHEDDRPLVSHLWKIELKAEGTERLHPSALVFHEAHGRCVAAQHVAVRRAVLVVVVNFCLHVLALPSLCCTMADDGGSNSGGPPTSAHDATCGAPVQAFSGFLSAVFGLRVPQGDAPAAGTDPVLSSFRRGAQTAAEQPALHPALGSPLGNGLLGEDIPGFLQNAAALHAPSLDMLREQLRPVSLPWRRGEGGRGRQVPARPSRVDPR